MFDEEKHDISKLYKNKKVLNSEQTTILQQIDAQGDLEAYKLLYFISDFERQNYWESAINRFDTDGHSAMHHCVDLLIAAHPHKPRNAKPVRLSPDDWDVKNENPWYRAVRIFLSLINAGASVNSRKIHQFHMYDTPLKYAIAQSAPRDVLELLIKHGAYVDEFDFCCHTPLMSAIYYGDDMAIEVLLRAGANPNTAYEDGEHLLHQALHMLRPYCLKKWLRVINMLLAHGANPNMLGFDGENCIEYGLFRRGPARWDDEAEYGIEREMILLRRKFRKYGAHMPKPRRTRKQYIRAHTWHGRDRETGAKTRDSAQAERAYWLIERVELIDDIEMHIIQNKPLSAALMRRARAAGLCDADNFTRLPQCTAKLMSGVPMDEVHDFYRAHSRDLQADMLEYESVFKDITPDIDNTGDEPILSPEELDALLADCG